MNFLAKAAIIIFPLITGTPTAVECDQPAYVVKVWVDHGEFYDVGTGALIRNNLVLSANHVTVDDTRKTPIYVQFYNGDKVEAQRVWWDKDQDVALLQIPTTNHETVSLGDRDPTPGTDITIYGWADGKTFSSLESKVHEYYNLTNDGKATAFSVRGTCISGMSGGPAVTDGKLVGVLFGADKEESYCGNLSKIKKFIKGFDNRKKKR